MTAPRRNDPPDTGLEHGFQDWTARRAEANRAVDGKALPERSALKPYRGKPAARNFREGDGNNGIIEARSAPSPYSTAIDGKVLRRFFDRARDARSNEAAQAPKLLRRLPLRGAIATADASNWPAWQIPGNALSYYR